jgi:hypothetical protein
MLASLAGIFFAGIFAYKTALKKGIDEVEMIILLLVSAACSLVGIIFFTESQIQCDCRACQQSR